MSYTNMTECTMRFSDFGRFKWKGMIALKSFVLEAGGYIYGGFVRDMVRHDKAAAKFYTRMNEYSSEKMRLPLYNDREAEVDTNERLVVPFDIDVVFYSISALDLFYSKVKEEFTIRVTSERTDYLPESMAGFKQFKLYLTCKVSPLLQEQVVNLPVFFIDVLVATNDDTSRELPPFGPCDFECNTLVMFMHHGQEIITTKLSHGAVQNITRVSEIMDAVVRKCAVFTHIERCEWRVMKMLDKGFTITTGEVQLVNAKDTSDVCVICHMEVDGAHMKRRCCSALYHPKCLGEVEQKCTECPTCRRPMEVKYKASNVALCGSFEFLQSKQNAKKQNIDDITFNLPSHLNTESEVSWQAEISDNEEDLQ